MVPWLLGLKKVGETVEEGDILAEIETDKATMEFECFYEGTILHIGVQEGETAPVDSLLAIIGPAGTDVSAIVAGGVLLATPASDKAEAPAAVKEEIAIEEPKTVATTNNSHGSRIFASPLAKKIASDKGYVLSEIKGSGENGRIIKKDVENYTPAAIQVADSSTKPTATSCSTNFAMLEKKNNRRKELSNAESNSEVFREF